MEIWDAYNENGEPVGVDLIRGKEIPEGLFHIISEILVVHKDGTYLLMQRDLNKQYGGYYEASAGGSALKGETPYTAAIRELKEETGIESTELKQIYRFVEKDSRSIYYGFLCETDCNKNSVTLQAGETISYLWTEKDEFLKFMESDKCIWMQRDRLKNYLDLIK